MTENMKKTLIAATLALCCITALADDYNYMTVTTGTSDRSIRLATIQKITFESGNVVVTTSQGIETFPHDEMRKIVFEDSPTDIATLQAESGMLKVTGGVLTVGRQGLLCIYTPNGTLHSMTRTEADSQIELSALPQGVYIIKLNNETIKYIKP